MSRQRLPWYRQWAKTYRNEDYERMSLAEQAVYRNLMDYASEQTPRGTFQVEDLRLLANRVAQGDTDTLKRVLDYCGTAWTEEDGEAHIVTEGGRGRFTTWETWQAPPRSMEPDDINARQRRYKERREHGEITDEKPLNNESKTVTVEEEEDREEDTAVADSAHARKTPSEPVDSSSRVCRALTVDAVPAAVGIVEEALRAYPDLPHVLKAAEFRERKGRGFSRMSPVGRATGYANYLDGAARIRREQQQQPERSPPNGAEERPIYQPSAEAIRRQESLYDALNLNREREP